MAKPWGDSSRYDVVIETGGRFARIQVKSTANRQPNGGYVCGVHPCPGELYKRGDFDFLAAYLTPEDFQQTRVTGVRALAGSISGRRQRT